MLSATSYASDSTTQNAKKIVVFAPHPDDDIIGCGGSIAKHIHQQNNVAIVYLTSGEACDRNRNKEEIAAMREQEGRAAAKMLGVESLYFLKKPAGNLSTDQDIIVELVAIIRQEQPHIIYIPHANDGHRDHSATYRLVVNAIQLAGSSAYQEYPGKPWRAQLILCYEVWTPLTKYSYREDISEFIEIKLAALRKHRSQLVERSYDKAIEGLNRYRGEMQHAGSHCECFKEIILDQRIIA